MAQFNSAHNAFYEKYDISPRYGFLTEPRDPPGLPADFDMFAEIFANLGNTDGKYYRKLVDDLALLNHPQEFYINLAKKQPREVQKQVYAMFTFMVQQYVRCLGKAMQLDTIPYEIGLIWHHTAETFKLPTVTTYMTVALTNWRLLDPSKPLTFDNCDAIMACSGTEDERWFYRVHIGIESIGAQVLRQMHDVEETMATLESSQEFLVLLQKVLVDIRDTLLRMREGCDPERYWNYVRIFLGGYTADTGLPDGLNIRGTEIKEIKFGGGSAAQSSLIQAFDEFLGVEHPSDRARDFLRQQRSYMPERHVAYLQALGAHRSVRDLVMAYDNEQLTEQYNAVMRAFGKFRATHYAIVHQYVVKFINSAIEKHDSGDLDGELVTVFMHCS